MKNELCYDNSKRKILYKELGTMNQRIIEMEKDEDELNTKDKAIGNQLSDLENKKIELVRKLYKIDETYDIEELNTIKGNLTLEQQNITTQLADDKEYKEQLRPMYMDYHKKLAEIDEEKIQEDYEEYKELKKDVRDYENALKLNESKTKSLNHHNADLMKFKYDEEL